MTPQQRAEALDWLAWTDPDDGRGLSQAKIGAVVGIGQAAVSRLARLEKA
jgi:predicted XRE-type DNA-binding protein